VGDPELAIHDAPLNVVFAVRDDCGVPIQAVVSLLKETGQGDRKCLQLFCQVLVASASKVLPHGLSSPKRDLPGASK